MNYSTSFILLLIHSMDPLSANNHNGTASNKPVKLDLSSNTGSEFLDRLFQIITVILLMVILAIFIITSCSVMCYFYKRQKNRRKVCKQSYDIIESQMESEMEEKAKM